LICPEMILRFCDSQFFCLTTASTASIADMQIPGLHLLNPTCSFENAQKGVEKRRTTTVDSSDFLTSQIRSPLLDDFATDQLEVTPEISRESKRSRAPGPVPVNPENKTLPLEESGTFSATLDPLDAIMAQTPLVEPDHESDKSAVEDSDADRFEPKRSH
jgi:hypothetical protein